MERLDRREVEQILGIYAPFIVKDITIDSDNEIITVCVQDQSTKPSQENEPQNRRATKRWQHIKLGRFTSFIEIEASPAFFSKIRSTNPPTFLGDLSSQYTNQLKQTILFAASNNTNNDVIHAVTGASQSLIEDVIADDNTEESEKQASRILPVETAPIWRAIINNEMKVHTSLPSLKFLITRLNLTYANSQNDLSVMQDSIATLRQFFIKYSTQLKSEFAQLGVSDYFKINSYNKNHNQLTLTPEHPIWEKILSGKLELTSKHAGFSLFITQLKSLYSNDAKSSEEIAQITHALTYYIKKKRSKLKTELALISKMAANFEIENINREVPQIHHPVWQRLLDGDVIIDSNRMAYKLLLVKARTNKDHEQSILQIREYFVRNMRQLAPEIKQLEQQIVI